MTEDELQSAHDRAFRNKPIVTASTICGCFFCRKTCAPGDVREWVRKDNETALCPHCGIDALIGDASGLPVTDATFLSEMHAHWFKKVSTVSAAELAAFMKDSEA